MPFFVKFSFNKRMIPQYILLLLSAAFAVYTLFLITGHQMKYLSYLLYDRSYLSAVYQLLNQFVITKLLLSVILLFMMLLSLFLYYFTYRMPAYLEMTILCFLSVICCDSLAEKNTMFFIGSSAAHLWYSIYLSSFLFFSYITVSIVFSPELTILRGKYHNPFLHLMAALGISFYFFTHTLSQSLPLLFFILTLLLAAGFVTEAVLIRKKRYRSMLLALPVCVGHLLLLLFNYRYFYFNDTLAQINLGERLYQTVPYITFVMVIYLYILIINRQKVFLNSRYTNREIQAVENAKYAFLTIISAGVRNHTKTVAHMLPEASVREADIRHELDSIDALFRRISNYNIFNKNQLTIRLTTVDTHIFLKFILEHLKNKHVLTGADTCSFAPGPSYIRIAPEGLMQSVYDLIYTLKDKFPTNPLQISCFRQGGSIHLEFHLENTPRIRTLLQSMDAHNIFFSSNAVESLDYIVSTCRYMVSLSKGQTRLILKDGILVSIQLPVFSNQPPACRQYTLFPPSQTARMRERLLLITSDLEQEEELKKSLPLNRYTVTFCSDASHYYKNPLDLNGYSLIIIGNLYHGIFYNDFLIQVRQYFSMTELPVLLILPNLLSETEVYVHSNINDFLAPPVSSDTLELKIKSLLSMKRTADMASEAKLEFLQSQMNPHFIFNSINSIMQFCIEAPMTAYQLLGDFSEYLRGHLFSLSLDRVSTIQKEIDLISAYLQIEKARFGNHVNYRLNADCDENFPILPLLIEPLVENSIKHSPMNQKGVTITVDIFQEEELLQITVTDNGKGMTKEMIDSILNYTAMNRSIGLYNVCNRLKYYYHTTPQIESMPGQGTSISFSLSRNIHMNRLEDTL